MTLEKSLRKTCKPMLGLAQVRKLVAQPGAMFDIHVFTYAAPNRDHHLNGERLAVFEVGSIADRCLGYALFADRVPVQTTEEQHNELLTNHQCIGQCVFEPGSTEERFRFGIYQPIRPGRFRPVQLYEEHLGLALRGTIAAAQVSMRQLGNHLVLGTTDERLAEAHPSIDYIPEYAIVGGE